MAKLKGPESVVSVTVAGKEIAVHDGIVEVAAEHVKALARHGFQAVKNDADKAPKRAELHVGRKG